MIYMKLKIDSASKLLQPPKLEQCTRIVDDRLSAWPFLYRYLCFPRDHLAAIWRVRQYIITIDDPAEMPLSRFLPFPEAFLVASPSHWVP